MGCLVAVILYEVFLSEDACWLRTKAWLTDVHYYRHHSYYFRGKPQKTPTQGEFCRCHSLKFSPFSCAAIIDALYKRHA